MLSVLKLLEIIGAVETTLCGVKTWNWTLDDGFAAQGSSINLLEN